MSYYNYYAQQQQQQRPNAANLSWFNTQQNYTFSQQGYCTPSVAPYQPTYSYSYLVTPTNVDSQVFTQIPIDDRYVDYDDIQENSLGNASSVFTESKTTITGSLSSLAKSTTIGTLARERSKSEPDEYFAGSDSTIVNNMSEMTRSKINTGNSDNEIDETNDESNKQLATRITPSLFDTNTNRREKNRDREITTEGIVSVLRRLTELSKLTRRDGMSEKEFVHAIHNCMLDRDTAKNIFTQLTRNKETLKISDLFTDVASLIKVIEDVILEARLSSGSRLY